MEVKRKMTKEIEVELTYYRELNQEIRDCIRAGETEFKLTRVFGQRYIGDALQAPVHIDITGTPGNDMAAFMDGATIEVHGNGQDQVANTMNDGTIVIHGRCGDATGYGMRGGSVYIRDSVGWRNGIHMKQYQDKCPTLVIGGDAGAFLGEYMAGGIILLLGKPEKYVGNSMHGGMIYLAEPMPEYMVNEGLIQEELEDFDRAKVQELLDNYNAYFGRDEQITSSFRRLHPASSRPYAGMYT